MNDSRNGGREAKERGGRKIYRVIGQAAMLAVLVAAGWFLRSLLPSGPPPGPPGGLGGPGDPPAVVVEPVRSGVPEAPSEYVGYVEPIQSVDIRAQVAGYLEVVQFEEGSCVSEGDLLFLIQQKPFEARVALTEAGVAQAKSSLPAANADLDAAKANHERADAFLRRLKNADERSVVEADMDAATADFLQARARVQQAEAAVKQAEAAVQQAEAALGLARIDLGFTEIRSPITGRIGKAMATKGNYVCPAGEPLAQVVQMDPIRVVFSITDREHVETLNKQNNGGAPSLRTRLRLPNGVTFSKPGRKDFSDNQMNPQTGTIAVRARFANPDGLLVPRSYVTVLTDQPDTTPLPYVPQAAVMTDQRGQFVFVVNQEGVAEERRIAAGPAIGGRQYVEAGLESGEQVIVQGLQKARPGQQVVASLGVRPESDVSIRAQ